eukprot:snap_masked-scaffold_1-processed-gene-11.21-mRNA-1 protein AED:1.00 eAED:1.00 QI:0/-1/0/0/-1/1/1/0/258
MEERYRVKSWKVIPVVEHSGPRTSLYNTLASRSRTRSSQLSMKRTSIGNRSELSITDAKSLNVLSMENENISELLRIREADASYSTEQKTFWILENTVDFFNSLVYLWSSATDRNEAWFRCLSGKNKGFAEKGKFLWRNSAREKPVLLNAHEYCTKALLKIETIFEKKSFPWKENQPLPRDIYSDIKQIWKYLLRVLIILVSNECLARYESYETTTRAFLFFGWQWQLVHDKEVRLISEVALPLLEEYKEYIDSTEFV